MVLVDARGDACPLPVVKAKQAIAQLEGPGQVEVLVDNEIAVQNLTKMARQKGYETQAEKQSPGQYRVLFTVGQVQEAAAPATVVHRTSAPELWWPLTLPRWGRAAQSWARRCSRLLCLR